MTNMQDNLNDHPDVRESFNADSSWSSMQKCAGALWLVSQCQPSGGRPQTAMSAQKNGPADGPGLKANLGEGLLS
jgi:hypothetical protein